MRTFSPAAAALAALTLVTATAGGQAAPRRPALVVLIAIDQFRGDYIDRYAKQYTGAFARIRRDAAFFPNGYQNHANTETAPGHSTMLSGREPTHTGIVSNDRGVPDPGSPLIGYPGPGASPARFNGTTLFDWLRIADPRARALSVSRKDRGAILTLGRAKESVFWWAPGAFTTSRYYADTLPTWVRRFNARDGGAALAGGSWNLFRPAADYAEPDSMPFEHGGADFTFPHPFPRDSVTMRRTLANYPWMDSLTLAFALDGVKAMRLGQDGSTDLLSISLSTTDAVGHAYGPDSRELHDQLLRLDAWLGRFLDELAGVVPADRTVFALTGDHGVTPLPEYTVQVRHQVAGRTDLGRLARATGDSLFGRYAVDFGIDFNSGLLTADTAALHARGIAVDGLARSLAAAAKAWPGVATAYTPKTLAAAPASDTMAMRWRNAIPPDVAWLVAAIAKPGYAWSAGTTADHGTLNDLDMWVPVAFWGAGVKPGVRKTRVRTVDIAPTLAAGIGIRPSEPIDGRTIAGVFAAPGTGAKRK